MIQKDPFDIICDVTKSKKCKINAGRHDSSVWQQHLMCLSLDSIIYVCCKMSNFSIHHILIMGEVTWLIWPQMTCLRNPRYTYKMWAPGGLLLSVCFSFLKKDCLSSAELQSALLCDCADVYLWHHSSVAWPDLKMKKKELQCPAWMHGVRHAKFPLSIANSSGPIAESRLGDRRGPTPSAG